MIIRLTQIRKKKLCYSHYLFLYFIGWHETAVIVIKTHKNLTCAKESKLMRNLQLQIYVLLTEKLTAQIIKRNTFMLELN